MDKSALAFGLDTSFRDPAYLREIRERPCWLSNFESTENEKVDPAHVTTGGVGLKSHDFYCKPLRHSLHHAQHQIGEASFWRQYMSDRQLLECVKAHGIVEYLKWVFSIETDGELVRELLAANFARRDRG